MESITNVLTNPTFWSNVPSFVLLLVVLAVLAKVFKVRIKTDHITVGGEDATAYYERAVVRNQVNQAKLFCMALENKVLAMVEAPKNDGYFAKYVLECVFDKICEWIMYNHMENTDEYIESKQWEIQSLVYSFNPPDVFKTPEFQARMNKWVAEIIGRMVSVRKLYNKKNQKEKA